MVSAFFLSLAKQNNQQYALLHFLVDPIKQHMIGSAIQCNVIPIPWKKKKANYTNVSKMASLTLWQENVLVKPNKNYICWKLGSIDTDAVQVRHELKNYNMTQWVRHGYFTPNEVSLLPRLKATKNKHINLCDNKHPQLKSAWNLVLKSSKVPMKQNNLTIGITIYTQNKRTLL